MDAVLKREYGVHVPGKLNEAEWLRLYAEYRMLRKTELEELEIVTMSAMAKVLNRLFSQNDDHQMDSGTC